MFVNLNAENQDTTFQLKIVYHNHSQQQQQFLHSHKFHYCEVSSLFKKSNYVVDKYLRLCLMKGVVVVANVED